MKVLVVDAENKEHELEFDMAVISDEIADRTQTKHRRVIHVDDTHTGCYLGGSA